MPRVVQVPSEDTGVNVCNADSSENEDTVNRNFNQTINFSQESVTTYIRFPINYSLYNVTYFESENDPYCLRCVIGGRVKKFKKDARTWLHKSSDRKRKMGEETSPRYGINASNATANKNLKLVSEAQQIISCGGTYRFTTYKTDAGNDVLSDISSLGDSEADLTYSEESSPSLTSETREKYQKSVRFDHNINERYRTDALSSDSDESVNVVGKTTSSRNIVFQEELKFMEEEGGGGNIYDANESRNNIRPGPIPLQVSRIVPAIRSECASLQETLLDCAVNNKTPFCDQPSKPKHQASSMFRYYTRRGTKWNKTREENTITYNLRSARKFESNSNDENADQVVPSLKPRCREETNQTGQKRSPVDVKPAAASLDLTFPRQSIGTDETPSCSRVADNNQEFTCVPKLFFLASLALYTEMKCNLNKCS
ncbi:uncharacterized protein LOC132729503 [Ruditapes philippinarum]|uniref:uncharacterized protein LOC132729503 n=1 Tax=Ruditapes philippinarum TaxID=129788 RepID=UPI00295AD955|nr:uncharacterized protein LOC132729503 [Ruditapes philippinarum]